MTDQRTDEPKIILSTSVYSDNEANDAAAGQEQSRKSHSLWNDPAIDNTLRMMDPATRYKYQQIGKNVYNTIDYEDPESVGYESAAQIDLMLRDGLAVCMLTENERKHYVNIYGLNRLESYEKDEQKHDR